MSSFETPDLYKAPEKFDFMFGRTYEKSENSSEHQKLIDDVGMICYYKYIDDIKIFREVCVDMVSREVLVNNQVGLHARPATFFIQKANEFKCGIWVEKDGRRVNAKSLLGVLSLGIVKGTTITIIADGAEEDEAVEALNVLISSNFSE